MADVTVPTAPPLATIANVELVQAGQWSLSTGVVTFTPGDLASAVASVDCPAVRRPVLKLGHTDPRFDGEPAVGWVANMALTDSGFTVVGDYVGMPGWLGDVMASAYPDRSIEGCFDWICQLGHTHPFVITAVALLGVMAPGVGTLESLQDVAALYGVAATSQQGDQGQTVAVTIHASKEQIMPNPRPVQVAAAVSVEDLRREYYDDAPWSVWICEVQIDPDLQLIVVDDNSGQYSRVPITVAGDAITFAPPIPVVIQYVDKPAASETETVGASAGRIVFASRAESRPGPKPSTEPVADPAVQPDPAAQIDPVPPVAASQNPPAVQAEATTSNQEGAGMDPAKLREALGLLPEATDEEVQAAIAEAGLAPETEVEVEPVAAAPALPEGTVVIDEVTLAQLRDQAAQGVAARAQQVTEARDHAIKAAVDEGRIPPARREHWQKLWDADPDGTKTTLASLAAGTVPLADVGTPGTEDLSAQEAEFADYDRLFSRPAAREA